VSFDSSAASSAASPASLRPYDPGPGSHVARTFSGGRPTSFATPLRPKCGFWEPVHSRASPARTSATAQAGPMLACDWNGHSYSASITLRAVPSAASTSPRLTGTSRPIDFAPRM